jgi:hypothetical protein
LELSLDDEATLRSSTVGCHSLRLLGVVRYHYGTPTAGLVLQCTAQNDGEYIRVGFWSVDSRDRSHYEILDAFDSPSLSPGDFEAVDSETGDYTIKII